MLPILRTISVGGVLLAITILALALSPPGGAHRQFVSVKAPARGALLDRGDHPEWRQFLILAAFRRADELNRLHELPDNPVIRAIVPKALQEAPLETSPETSQETSQETSHESSNDVPKVAGLPADRADVAPDDETGSINAAPSLTIPIDIGAPSSAELPIMPTEEKPPVAEIPEAAAAPEQRKPAREAPKPIVQRRRAAPPASEAPKIIVHRRRAAPPAPVPAQKEAPIPLNLLQAFFEKLLSGQPAAADNPSRAPAGSAKPSIKPKRPAVVRSVSQ